MGKQVSVYVRDEDQDLWERAERYARARRLPMSALVMTALEAYLDDQEPDRG
jgi:post-segregation antitoxin (ccd killing protein)